MIRFTLRGSVDESRLRAALKSLVARHDALRSTISEDGEWMCLEETQEIELEFLDLLRPASGSVDEAVEHVSHAPIHPVDGPLFRAAWIRISEHESVIVLTAHSAVLDEPSATLLVEELGVLYSGNPEELAPVTQFCEHALAEQKRAEHGELASNERYWQKRFEAVPAGLDLPLDHPRTSTRISGNGSHAFKVDAKVLAELISACRTSDCSLEELLVFGFEVLMHRLSGQGELVVLLATPRRAHYGKANMVGQSARLLPLFSRLTEGVSAKEHLRATKAVVEEARQHQDFSYESLLRRMRLEREDSLLPSVSVQICLEQVRVREAFTGLGAEANWIPRQRITKDLQLNVRETESGLTIACDFNADVFEQATIARWMEAWMRLLRASAAEPETRVDDLPLLNEMERETILETWNRTSVDWGGFASLPEIFLKRALAEPHQVALECSGVRWTNERLREAAQRLARQLQAEGVHPGGLVGIAVERSAEMVVAVLGVLMAGAAYLPLDPRHPQERLEMILEDAGAPVLLTSGTLALNTTAKVLNVLKPAPASTSTGSLPRLGEDSLAYVIYTSGSTGKPKGVAIEHGALMNLLRSMAVTPGLTSEDTLVAITTLSFDIATMELLLPLLTGARLVIATDEEVHGGHLLLGLLARSGATVLQATPGHWRVLIDAGWSEFNSPKALPLKCLCGGEPLQRDLAEKLLERSGELWNVYGPTETTIWSSATRVLAGENSGRVGPPIANTQIYVLDARRNPVPVGVVGELYIAGSGLAREYWKRPELTASKFVPNPFARLGHSSRMYATADLARFHTDGSIELLGRADFQVKIGGYRIELGEIEAAISRHPRVVETVVLAHTRSGAGTTERTSLIAHVVGRPAAAGQPDNLFAEIQAELVERLPAYMLPSSFVSLTKLPRTPNGKIDRKALLPSSESSAHAMSEFRAPADVIESQLVDLWQTTLGVPSISTDSSFFALGFGSLVALRLVTKINRAFGMNLGIASLVSAPSIEAVAELVRHRFEPNTTTSVVPLKTGGTRPPVFLIHGVGGNIVTFYGLSARMSPDQPVYGVQAQSLVGRQSAFLRLEDMASSYIQDMREVQPHGPYHLVGYSFGGTMALEIAHQLRAEGEEVALLGMIDSRTRQYAEDITSLTPVQTRFTRRMLRFRGNTEQMPLFGRVSYVAHKLYTRAIRLMCRAACEMRLKRVPSFMRSTWDINHVAIENYVERRYDGRMVMFLPSEQPAPRGPKDLGWADFFSQGVEIHEMPGDHDVIFLEPNIDRLASSLSDALAHAGTSAARA